jgi:Ig domain of plant-specific actin-binding protein
MASMRLIRSTIVVVAAAAVVASGALAGSAAGTPPVATTQPSVSGTALRGQTLTAQSGSWSGTTPISFAYQWRRCSSSAGDCANVSGATSETYTLASSDVGHTLRVQVTATNSAGSAQAVSGPTAVVVAPGPPANTAAPAVAGTAQDGHTLSVTNGTWKSDSTVSYTYKWVRCDSAGNNCATISGATHSSYKASSVDVGRRLRATVTAKNSVGSTSATSSATGVVVAAGVAPQNTSRPSLSGTPKEGQTLTVCCGSWSGTQPITLAFRWVRCGVNGAGPCDTITGATQQSYTLTAQEIGRTVQAFVTAANAYGTIETGTAASATVVRALPVGAVKLADGRISIPVTSVSLPQRLIIAGISLNPKRIRSRATGTVITVRVVDSQHHLVRGALVSVTGFPAAWLKPVAARRTALDGTIKLRLRPTAKLPLKKGGSLALLVRARKPGGNPFAGISAGRMFRVGLGPR